MSQSYSKRSTKLVLGVFALTLWVSGCRTEHFDQVFAVPDDLYSVAAIGSDHMWAAGYFGAIYRTKDAGKSWEKLESGTQKSIYDITFADENTGWAVGRHGFVIHTRDGGDSWENQELPRKPARHIFSIHAIDKENIWAVGDWGGRYFSRDGGKTWQDDSFVITRDHHSFPYLTEAELEAFERGEKIYDDLYLNDIYFLDRQRGFIVGEYGQIFRTENGGDSWEKAQIQGAVSFEEIEFPAGGSEIPRELWSDLFAASEILLEKEYLRLRIHAYLTPAELAETGDTTLADDRGESLRDFLESEGISQDRIKVIDPTPFDEESVDMDAFRASKLSEKPIVRVEVVETPFLFDIKMLPDGRGLIAGLGGVLLSSSDLGKTWTYGENDARQAFFAVGIGASRYVAVGEKGLRRTSEDAGASWDLPESGFPKVVAFMRDMIFTSDREGWIVGANSMVLRTTDGGATWNKLELNEAAIAAARAAEALGE